MNPAFSQCSLYLCPAQHDIEAKDLSLFIDHLRTIGFISQQIDTTAIDNRYLTGARFLDYIAYMGCSPAVQFEADENDNNFCHIHIHQHESAKLIVSKKQARAPHCPSCARPVKHWNENKDDSTILCDQCHTRSNIEAFNWRRMAGYSRLFLEVTDIFPKEAVPQQCLLDELSQSLDTEWQYFYACK